MHLYPGSDDDERFVLQPEYFRVVLISTTYFLRRTCGFLRTKFATSANCIIIIVLTAGGATVAIYFQDLCARLIDESNDSVTTIITVLSVLWPCCPYLSVLCPCCPCYVHFVRVMSMLSLLWQCCPCCDHVVRVMTMLSVLWSYCPCYDHVVRVVTTFSVL